MTFKNLFNQIENSFHKANAGSEDIQKIMWQWGGFGYLFAFFIADTIVKKVDLKFVDVVISLIMVCYFSWHFYVTKKCSPKKPKLNPEEQKKIQQEARKEVGKAILRKLFLKESIKKWDPIFTTYVIDVFCIAVFLDYITR